MKSIKIYSFFFIFIVSIVACEDEITSPGNGGNLYQILKIGLFDWDIKDIKVFSGSKGVIINGFVHGGNLKSEKISMIDNISKFKIFEKVGNTFIADQFRFNDTVYFQNIVDTVYAKITIEGKDENEMRIVHWHLKIVK